MKQTHKIRKQSLLLNFTNEAEAISWNRSASEFNERNIVPLLDKLFNHYAGKNDYFEIEKLEINIGSVTAENFLSALENELEKQLNGIFRNQLITDSVYTERQSVQEINGQNKEFGKHANPAESSHWMDTFSYFLDYGTLPWNSRTQQIRTLQKELLRIISRNELEKSKGLRQQLINTNTRKRLHSQFSADFNMQVLSRLFVSEYELLLKLHNGLVEILKPAVQNEETERHSKIINNKPGLMKWISLEASANPDLWPLEYMNIIVKTIFRKDRQLAFEVLNNAVQFSGRRRNVAGFWITKYLKDKEFGKNDAFTLKNENVLTDQNELAKNVLNSGAANELNNKNRSDLKAKIRKQTKKESTTEISSETAQNFKQNKEQILKNTVDSSENNIKVTGENSSFEKDKIVIGNKGKGRKEIRGKDQKIPLGIGSELPFQAIKKDDLKSALTGIKTKSKSGRQRQDEALSKAAEKQENRIPEKGNRNEFLAEPDFYYLSNTGVLLTWPYLTSLFRIVGFTENNQFKNERFMHRAVHLMAYIATGKTQSEEPQLLIAKLLCGMPLHMPVLKKFRLSKIEKGEVNVMLENLIANWPILKNTSVEGLRSSFFAREGKLVSENGQWNIIVEQKSFDMLLDHLPYPISIIKLPWMNEVLRVDWM